MNINNANSSNALYSRISSSSRISGTPVANSSTPATNSSIVTLIDPSSVIGTTIHTINAKFISSITQIQKSEQSMHATPVSNSHRMCKLSSSYEMVYHLIISFGDNKPTIDIRYKDEASRAAVVQTLQNAMGSGK